MRRYPKKYTPREKLTLIKVPSTAVSKLTHIATHSDHGSHTRDFGGWVPYFYSFTRQSCFAFPKIVKNVKFSSFSSLINPRHHFSIVLIKTNWYTISCKYYECTSLASVNIPNSVTTIGEGAFAHCLYLASVDIPNSVTTIGRRAFCYCASLTSVNIGESVTTIGDGAFLFCDAITSVTCLAKECPVCDKGLWNNIFSVFDTATLYVPKQSIDAYKTTDPWSNFVNVVALEATGIEGTPTDNAPRVDAVYDIDGRRTDSMKRGLNIVRMSDGTTRKVMK